MKQFHVIDDYLDLQRLGKYFLRKEIQSNEKG